jgi:hypothetical protein
MVIRGLQRYGRGDLAREVALNHLDLLGQVFAKTGTLWENYAADAPAPGRPAGPDLVGWSGLGPILYLLEFAIGLKPDAPSNTLLWEVPSPNRLGVDRYRFNGHVISLQAEPVAGNPSALAVSVSSDGAFRLVVRHADRETTSQIAAGQNVLSFP